MDQATTQTNGAEYTHVAYYPDRRESAVFFNHNIPGEFDKAVQKAMRQSEAGVIPKVEKIEHFNDRDALARSIVRVALSKVPREGWEFDDKQGVPVARALGAMFAEILDSKDSKWVAVESLIVDVCAAARDNNVKVVNALFDDLQAVVSGRSIPRADDAIPTVEEQHASLASSGVDLSRVHYFHGASAGDSGKVSEGHLLRAREHGEKLPVREAAEQLAECVRGEAREDIVLTAKDLAESMSVNGAVKVAGYKLTKDSVRALFSRIEATHATKYVFGLRDRIAENVARLRSEPDNFSIREEVMADKSRIAATLYRELTVAGDTEVKLRVRKATGDVYSVVSPAYSPADAPEVVEQLLSRFPADARGSWRYDPASTRWEIRASLWTPNDAAQHAVGEPFEGYVSVQGRDDGRGKVKGGGGILILACTNGATYCAAQCDLSRRHIGKVIADVDAMVVQATESVDALCAAWGRARESELGVPEDLGPISLAEALPGFWFGELRNPKSELHAVLPGRSASHVAPLCEAYFDQRRDSDRLVKADLANAWTKYAQGLPTDVRLSAEEAAAAWVVSRRPVAFDPDKVARA